MLHEQAVPERALELLKSIQSNPFFAGVRLVGGTALALQIGHRLSIDLDFFGDFPHDHAIIAQELNAYGNVVNVQNTKTIKIYQVDGIKVDFVNYHYAWLANPICEAGLTLAAKKDIAAMKISAITGRGTRKDFIDLHALLKDFTLAEMLTFFQDKYPDGSTYLALKSLYYFADADAGNSPEMLWDVPWETVKKEVLEKVKNLSL